MNTEIIKISATDGSEKYNEAVELLKENNVVVVSGVVTDGQTLTGTYTLTDTAFVAQINEYLTINGTLEGGEITFTLYGAEYVLSK